MPLKTHHIIQLLWWEWCLDVCSHSSPTADKKYFALTVHRN